MTSGPAPICGYCIRFKHAADTLVCEAFPTGIPGGVIDNILDHRGPLPGDHGIQFVLDPKRAPFDEDLYDGIFASGVGTVTIVQEG